MAESNSRRWRKGAPGRPANNQVSGRLTARIGFTLVTMALVAMIVWLMIPPDSTRTWVCVYYGSQLDDLSPPIPFAKQDATEWIPAAVPESRKVVATSDTVNSAGEILQKIEDKFTGSSKPSPTKDTLVVYLVGYGVSTSYKDSASAPLIIGDTKLDADANFKSAIDAKELLNKLTALPFRTILVVFDCGRTLDSRRRGWNQSCTFTDGLKQVMPSIEGGAKSDKLWVISSAHSGQYGLAHHGKHHSIFGLKWINAIRDTLKKSPQQSDLKKLYVSLTSDSGSKPVFLRPGNGEALAPNDLPKNRTVLSGKPPEVSWTDSQDNSLIEELPVLKNKELTSEDKKKLEESISSMKFDRLGVSQTELDRLWSIWDELEKCENRLEGISARALGDCTPIDRDKLLFSPLIYAPHLWRRVKLNLVADEFRILEGSRADLGAYLDLVNNLNSWPCVRPSEESKSALDKPRFAWFNYIEFLRGTPNQPRSVIAADVGKAAEVAEAYFRYAKALSLFPELIVLDRRLKSVQNSDWLETSTAERLELSLVAGKAIPDLNNFLKATADNGSAATLVESGKRLEQWRKETLAQLLESAVLILPTRNGAVTLDLLLTSPIWDTNSRKILRKKQILFSQIAGPSIEKFERQTDRQPDKSPLIGAFKQPLGSLNGYPASVEQFRNLAEEQKRAARSRPDATDLKAHLWSSLIDPLDATNQEDAAWFEPAIKTEADREEIRLEVAVDENKKPIDFVSLDNAEGEAEFRFIVSWKPNAKVPPSAPLPLKLRAILDAADKEWLTAESLNPHLMTFDLVGSDEEPAREDSYRRKLIRWKLKMKDGKTRHPGETEAIQFRIEFDADQVQSLERDRPGHPKLQIADSKIPFKAKLKCYREASLMLTYQDEITPVRLRQSKFAVFEVDTISGLPMELAWKLTNQSPVPVAGQLTLWELKESLGWKRKRGPWGRVPVDSILGETTDRASKENTVKQPPALQTKFQFENSGTDPLVIKWPAETIKEMDATHGLFCQLTVDGGISKDYWIQFVPREPAKWLKNTVGSLKDIGDPNRGYFEIMWDPPDSEWPSCAYSTDAMNTLMAVLQRPKEWPNTDRDSVRILEQQLLRSEFKTEIGRNPFDVFLKVANWPRAFRWQVNGIPGQKGPQSFAATYRLNFTTVRFDQLSPPEAQNPSKTIWSQTADWSKNSASSPLYCQLPLATEVNTKGIFARLSLSIEADAPPNTMTKIEGGCPELRIEQIMNDADETANVIFRRCAERRIKTSVKSSKDRSSGLEIETSVADFEELRFTDDLKFAERGPDTDPIRFVEGLNRIQAAFYSSSNTRESSQEARNSFYVFFDRTPPELSRVSASVRAENDKLKFRILVESNDNDPTGASGSGIDFDKTYVWISKKERARAEQDKPPKEESVKSIVRTLNERQAVIEAMIDREESKEKQTYFVTVRLEDRVGLQSALNQVSSSVQVAWDVSDKPMANNPKGAGGVIDGVVFIERKGYPAKGYTVRLSPGNGETKTDDEGKFRFNGLDIGQDYTISVETQRQWTLQGGPAKVKATEAGKDPQMFFMGKSSK